MVEDGLGVPKGLMPTENLRLLGHADHPFRRLRPDTDDDLKEAVSFVENMEDAQTDEVRQEVIKRLATAAAGLNGDREAWTRSLEPRQRKLAAPLHGPPSWSGEQIHFVGTTGNSWRT